MGMAAFNRARRETVRTVTPVIAVEHEPTQQPVQEAVQEWTVDGLRTRLTELGIPFPKRATKIELLALLEGEHGNHS